MRIVSALYIVLVFSNIGHAVQIIWDNSATIDENFIDLAKSDEIRMPNWFFIYPGTKWCGAGDIADGYDDLGEFSDTDKCCRTHDYCDDAIEGYQTKHGLTNPSFYSRLNCACDEEFRKCLKSVDSRVSNQIGHIYFTALGTQCFKEDYPIVGCKKYSYLPTRKCTEYEYNTTAEQTYQWFDIRNF